MAHVGRLRIASDPQLGDEIPRRCSVARCRERDDLSGDCVILPFTAEVVTRLSGLAPANPFATPEYFDARRRAGWETWIIAADGSSDGEFHDGCGAFLATRGPFRKLEIPSLPLASRSTGYWDVVRSLCERRSVIKVEIGTFNSPEDVRLSSLGECVLRPRCEFTLQLEGDLWKRLSNRHRANVKRAVGAGVTLVRTRSASALQIHQSLIAHSMDRRRNRGEEVPDVGSSVEAAALLESCCGELYQATDGERVLSSALVLHAPNGAYGHSTGTSPEGMKLGASHFLIHSISTELAGKGVAALNFGAAEEGSGLARFKRDFGTTTSHLPSAVCYIGSTPRRVMYKALRALRDRQRDVTRRLKVDRMRADTASRMSAPPTPRHAEPPHRQYRGLLDG